MTNMYPSAPSSTSSSSSHPSTTTSVLSEQVVQDAFHSYLKSSLTQAKLERLLDAEVLSSAESDLMITGPALCLYFAALRCTTSPPSVPLPLSSKSPSSHSGPIDLSYENCPPAFTSFLQVWSRLVPQIQSLVPEHQHDLARMICNLTPLSAPPNLELGSISAALRAVALEISQRRSFQDRYASALQAALDFDTAREGTSREGGNVTGDGGGATGLRKKVASFVPPPVYEPTSPTVSTGHRPLSPSVSGPSYTPASSTTSFHRTPSPTVLTPGITPAIEFIRETLYAALGDALEQFPSLRSVLHSDPPRAYFASVSLAILIVATQAVDFRNLAVIGVLGTPLGLNECPPELQPLMSELISIGSSALTLASEDDEAAVQALSSGEEVPDETRMERVKKVLFEGVGCEFRRGDDDGRRSAEGRAVGFANRIGELAMRMTALKAFRERQDGVFKVLAGIGS